MKIDIEIPKEKRSKWEERNFPPIIAKRSLSESEISEEMLHLLRERKTKFPLGKRKNISLSYNAIFSSPTDELLE